MKIYFLVVTQDYNLGDLLINKLLIEELSCYGTVYVDSSGVSNNFAKYLYENKQIKNFEKEYGGSLKRFSALQLLSVVKNDFSYYFKSPGPSGGGLNSVSNLIRKFILFIEFAYLHYEKVHLNMVGNDIVIQSKMDVFIEKLNLRCFNNCLVRSKKNMEYLKSLKFPNVGYIPDLAFLYNNIDSSINRDSVLVSFRDLNDELYTRRIVIFLEKNIPYFISKNIKITFMYQVKSDKEFNMALYERFKDIGAIFIDNCIWYDDIYIYNRAKYVITNRLHVMLLGVVHYAIPILLLNQDQRVSKIDKILLDCELQNLSVDFFDDIRMIDDSYLKHKSDIVKLSILNRELCQDKIGQIFDRSK